MSLSAGLAGIGVFAVLRHFVLNPLRTFYTVAAVVLALSLLLPFLLPVTSGSGSCWTPCTWW
jgi:hypothetical protein